MAFSLSQTDPRTKNRRVNEGEKGKLEGEAKMEKPGRIPGLAELDYNMERSARMNHVERFRAVMNFQSVDRLPLWEWAMWWDETIARWHQEGLSPVLKCSEVIEIATQFGLDPYQQFWFSTTDPTIEATQHHVEGIISNIDDYRRLRPTLFPCHDAAIANMAPWAERQRAGAAVVWCTLEGFFWFPRTLMGFEKLMYAFADQPELLHEINQDLLQFNLTLLEKILRVCTPTFVTIAEDMSYNHGPMISRRTFNDFVAPYYRALIPRLLERDIIPIVDTDGDVTMLVPWLAEVGVNGVLPLERQAGVDGARLREQYPQLLMVGHFDKMTMTRGESAMRAEFERLAPLMKQGGFIPSVDHQTPPGVSLEKYHVYLRLLNEYVRSAHP
jgi:Uroporphyrinogen decarboxylase (URO-D)